VLSESQRFELKKLTEREKVQVVEQFEEARTAKVPGRPIFNAMLNRIERGEANGIIAWHPDRLARNALDGGRSSTC
jgi:site-specific DNA recombinase